MNETDRRDVLRNAGLAVTAAAIGDPLATTQAQAQTPRAADPTGPLDPNAVYRPRPFDPTKPFNPNEVGNYVQINYAIVTALFDPAKQKAFRQAFWDCTTEAELRNLFARLYIVIDPDTRIMVVDIENARTLVLDHPITPSTEKFYVYIMPPVPRRTMPGESGPSKGYTDLQAWGEAWHHAICDGYGM